MAQFIMFLIGIVSLAGAVGLFLWVKRREFYRHNEAGVEVFGNFKQMAFARAVDSLADRISCILALTGVLFVGFVLADIFM
ncbi:hypothetical protein [Suttonella ornithocola]|uniref:Uncharacterized protein n=1 Tax=Suttonella ornithocola TaxID=279832 RepID=A0A380MZ53_9GAMM|nr:hypothetical protein [Suttonella ornithocola]SUO97835.1 Uncharacterised protein [Suttonella ornithocola]